MVVFSNTNQMKAPSPISPSSKCRLPCLHTTMKESIIEINNDGVSLLQEGESKDAIMRLTRCLLIMRKNPSESYEEVYYHFPRPVQKNILTGNSDLSSTYVFTAPLEIEGRRKTTSLSSNDAEQSNCKLSSLVLFNLGLAYHLHALQLIEELQYEVVHDNTPIGEQACAFLKKSLGLYELCHSSLFFSRSDLNHCDLSIAVIIMNNIGEIHKELHQQREQQIQKDHYEYMRAAMSCSEQLIKIFMFFSANGQSKRLEGLGDILSNAIGTLNGPQTIAPAA